jgi:hypothetical protein
MLTITEATGKKATAEKSSQIKLDSKCSCGGWLLMTGIYVGPKGYRIERRCATCRTVFVEEKKIYTPGVQ